MPPREWRLRPQPHPSAELEALAGSPLLARLLAQRGLSDPQVAHAFLDPAWYRPSPPSSMPGMENAAITLYRAIDAGKRILVWGDFDADGQTSTALLITVLRRLAGEARVSYHIPLRSHGHGMRIEQLQQVLDRFPADLILTCDTGIAETDAVFYSRNAGIDVVITDHHELPAELRSLADGQPLWGLPLSQAHGPTVRVANAMVNPHFCPPDHPLATLPGVGVAWLLAQQLLSLFGRSAEAAPLLDLVALGIVADVARQVDDARYLLQLGLEQLRRSERPGLIALMEFAQIDPATATAESIGFQIGPRLNSIGRLDDASDAVELLTTTDVTLARTLAAKVDRLNRERKLLTSEAVTLALEMTGLQSHVLEADVLVLDRPDWHAGILGLVAGRLVEEFHRPSVVILAPPGEVARGSARSTPAVDIADAIAACGELLLSHGGHAGAAGFSLRPENVQRFRRQLAEQVALHKIPGVEAADSLPVDAELAWADASLDTAQQVARLGPFGLGNPAPVFMSMGLTLVEDQRFGQDGLHRRLVLRDEAGNRGTLTWFGGADAEIPVDLLDVAYTLNINEYKGSRTVKPYYVAIRRSLLRGSTISDSGHPPAISVIDLRGEPVAIEELPREAAWYAEGSRLDGTGQLAQAPRQQLAARHGGSLVLWSAPPSAELLDWMVETVSPVTVYLIGQATGVTSLDELLSAVTAMCKYAINHAQPADIGRMAARIGVTEAITRSALLYLALRGRITLVEWLAEDQVRLAAAAPCAERETTDLEVRECEARLREQMAEMRAFRRYFQTARADLLGIQTANPAP